MNLQNIINLKSTKPTIKNENKYKLRKNKVDYDTESMFCSSVTSNFPII